MKRPYDSRKRRPAGVARGVAAASPAPLSLPAAQAWRGLRTSIFTSLIRRLRG
ncbi:hypothetical protein BURMUCF2_A1276 [Burkholderia multivorans CF2]|nr:hypothetical protein BURMUCF2_A1276 [Burkholderia multivorans CF2]